MQPESGAPWTWDEESHPGVSAALAAPFGNLGWCDRLETAPCDAVVGKVLCVCAAAEIARAVIAANGNAPQPIEALALLDLWIDDPSDERFNKIRSLVFGDDAPDLGPHGVVSWALRTATSSVGNYEAGWALGGTCGAAERAGFSLEEITRVVQREVLARRKQSKPDAGS